MNESLRKRLTGAAVLVALGVIFIPALLDHNRQRQQLTDTMEIPPEPDIKLPEKLDILQEKQAQLQVESEASLAEPDIVIPQDEPAATALQDSSDVSTAAPDTGYVNDPGLKQIPSGKNPPIQNTSSIPDSQKQSNQQQAYPAQSHSNPNSLVKTSPETDQQNLSVTPAIASFSKGWVVQAGSFSQEPNALALKNSLLRAGQKAFMEKLKGRTGTIYRVRIGPVADRRSAEKLRDQLAKLGQKNLILMPYP